MNPTSSPKAPSSRNSPPGDGDAHSTSHGHGHGHGHGGHGHGGYGHGVPTSDRAFFLATSLNVLFVAVEVVAGLLANSTALLADASHNLGDVLGLVLAWGASALSRRSPTRTHTYGLRKTTILAAMANALLLVMVSGGVAWEAFGRFANPRPIAGGIVLWVALAGVLINSFSALLFVKGAKGDANIRGALLHLVSDAAVSAGVVVAGALVLWLPNWTWIDAVTSLAISVIILFTTWSLLRDAVHLSLDGVPQEIELDAVRRCLAELPGVLAIHDLHVWAMSTSEVALTAHLVVDAVSPPELLRSANTELRERFGISHSTIQLDSSQQETANCPQC